jgi:hypothetical protein
LIREDTKRVDRLEKLTKKIRGEAGGEDDDVQLPNAPSDVPSLVLQIAENAESIIQRRREDSSPGCFSFSN